MPELKTSVNSLPAAAEQMTCVQLEGCMRDVTSNPKRDIYVSNSLAKSLIQLRSFSKYL